MYTCEDCGKVLKTRGRHSHPAPDFEIVKTEKNDDNGKLAVSVTVGDEEGENFNDEFVLEIPPKLIGEYYIENQTSSDNCNCIEDSCICQGDCDCTQRCKCDKLDDGYQIIDLTVPESETGYKCEEEICVCKQFKYLENDENQDYRTVAIAISEEKSCICDPNKWAGEKFNCPEHKYLPECVYCKSISTSVFETAPSIISYKCSMCGKVWTINSVTGEIAWRL